MDLCGAPRSFRGAPRRSPRIPPRRRSFKRVLLQGLDRGVHKDGEGGIDPSEQPLGATVHFSVRVRARIKMKMKNENGNINLDK